MDRICFSIVALFLFATQYALAESDYHFFALRESGIPSRCLDVNDPENEEYRKDAIVKAFRKDGFECTEEISEDGYLRLDCDDLSFFYFSSLPRCAEVSSAYRQEIGGEKWWTLDINTLQCSPSPEKDGIALSPEILSNILGDCTIAQAEGIINDPSVFFVECASKPDSLFIFASNLASCEGAAKIMKERL
jgi:hypothetical protein